MHFLIDTNILIDHLRGDATSTEFLLRFEKGNDYASISVITEYELLVGPSPNSKEVLRIEQMLRLFPKISITSGIVRIAARFRQRHRTDTVDSLIAATAYSIKATLVTRNLKHFTPISEMHVHSLPFA